MPKRGPSLALKRPRRPKRGLKPELMPNTPSQGNTKNMLARMRALLRRTGGGELPLRVADLTLDPGNHSALRGDKHIPLSANEYKLLRALMAAPNRILTRAELLDTVWGYGLHPAGHFPARERRTVSA